MVLFINTRLKKAVKARDTERIAGLIAAGADINAAFGKTTMFGKKTPLHLAVSEGAEDVVGFLLEKGATPDAKDGYNWTPLHHAAHDGHLGIVIQLLKAGADPNLLTVEGRTAYGWATLRGASEVSAVIAPYMKKTAALLGADKPEAAPLFPATPPAWSLLSMSQVAHVETHDSLGYRLTDIFNFRNRERIRIVHNLGTKMDQASSVSFDEMTDKTQVEDARRELLRHGGQAEESAVFDHLQKPPRLNASAPKGG